MLYGAMGGPRGRCGLVWLLRDGTVAAPLDKAHRDLALYIRGAAYKRLMLRSLRRVKRLVLCSRAA